MKGAGRGRGRGQGQSRAASADKTPRMARSLTRSIFSHFCHTKIHKDTWDVIDKVYVWRMLL